MAARVAMLATIFVVCLSLVLGMEGRPRETLDIQRRGIEDVVAELLAESEDGLEEEEESEGDDERDLRQINSTSTSSTTTTTTTTTTTGPDTTTTVTAGPDACGTLANPEYVDGNTVLMFPSSGNYPDNTYCVWVFKDESGQFDNGVKFQIESLDIESSAFCYRDYLFLVDGACLTSYRSARHTRTWGSNRRSRRSSRRRTSGGVRTYGGSYASKFAKFCGQATADDDKCFVSSNNKMMLIFKSDGNGVTGTGFKGTFVPV